MLIPVINASGISNAVLIAHIEAISSGGGFSPLLLDLYCSIIDKVISVEPKEAPINRPPTLAAVLVAAAVPPTAPAIPPVRAEPAMIKPVCTALSANTLSDCAAHPKIALPHSPLSHASEASCIPDT